MKRFIFLSVIFSVLLFSGNIVLAGEYCRNIYCNEFDYICCCSDEMDESLWSNIKLEDYNPNSGKNAISCPTDLDVKSCHVQLDIISGVAPLVDDAVEIFRGFGDCTQIENSILHGKRWKCTTEESLGEKVVGSNPEFDLDPGERIYIWSAEEATINSGYTVRYYLKRTGRAGSCTGIDVTGSIGCTFNPQGSDYRVYDEDSGSIVNYEFELTETDCYRITTEGDKRVCGTTCDECKSDNDCAKLYPKQYYWGGRTLGGYCQNGQIVLYGCEGTGQEICTHFDDLNKNNVQDSNEKCYDTEEKKDCNLVKTITTGIECCTADDCQGAGDYYCEWIDDTHSKCSLKAQCEKDSDCGTSVECDRKTMEIKEHYCNSEKQCDERVIEKVDCCTSVDCQEKYYCTSDYECELKPLATTTTIGEKSEGTNLGTGQAGFSTGMATASPLGGIGLIILMIVIIATIGGGLFYFFYWKPRGGMTKKTVVEAPKDKTPKFCTKCGAKLKEGSKFCTKCGKAI